MLKKNKGLDEDPNSIFRASRDTLKEYKKSYEKEQAIPDSLKNLQQKQVTQTGNVLSIFSNSLKNINFSFKNVEYIINRTDKEIKSSTSDLLGSGKKNNKKIIGGTLTEEERIKRYKDAKEKSKNENKDYLISKYEGINIKKPSLLGRQDAINEMIDLLPENLTEEEQKFFDFLINELTQNMIEIEEAKEFQEKRLENKNLREQQNELLLRNIEEGEEEKPIKKVIKIKKNKNILTDQQKEVNENNLTLKEDENSENILNNQGFTYSVQGTNLMKGNPQDIQSSEEGVPIYNLQKKDFEDFDGDGDGDGDFDGDGDINSSAMTPAQIRQHEENMRNIDKPLYDEDLYSEPDYTSPSITPPITSSIEPSVFMHSIPSSYQDNIIKVLSTLSNQLNNAIDYWSTNVTPNFFNFKLVEIETFLQSPTYKEYKTNYKNFQDSSYFKTVKSSLLDKSTKMDYYDFLDKIHDNINFSIAELNNLITFDVKKYETGIYTIEEQSTPRLIGSGFLPVLQPRGDTNEFFRNSTTKYLM